MPVTIKKLLDSDRDDILEISRHIWDGHDYLSSVADKWLQDQNCHFYGVEVDGHVVALGNLRLVEDGITGWMEGLRVHPEHRGKGFANEITHYLVAKAEHLGVQRLRYTTSNRNTASLKLAEMAGLSKVLEMAVFGVISPKPIPSAEKYPQIKKASPERVYRLLKNSPSFIPYKALIYDWKALDVSLQNLEEIGKNHEFNVALRKRKLDSLSFGYPRPEPVRVWWGFTVYAADSDGFMSQLSRNATIASERGLSSVICIFETKFEKTLKKVDWGTKEQWRTHLVLLERQLHTQTKPKRSQER